MSPLTSEEKQFLLRLARQAVADRLEGKQPAALTRELPPISPALEHSAGVFVSLHKAGELRGCVGLVEPRIPLYRAIMQAAVSAALEDPRFYPVRAPELEELDIEISLLSPCQPIAPDQIQIGIHGLIVSQGQARGLLLPQVAVERQWGRERFLEETCRKAGLPLNAWRTGARVEAFRAEVFGERSAAGENRSG